MLQQKDLDAVIIATPPHWHALIAITACEAGKDIYVQKPMTLHLAENFAVRNAVRKHNTICQVGTQIHASENYPRVVELIRSGNLGPVAAVRTFNVMNQMETPPKSIPPSPGHEREWLDCIKSRQRPSCSVFYHVHVDVPILLSLLALKLGRSIRFDPATEKIVGDSEAARLAVPQYRAPWKFPKMPPDGFNRGIQQSRGQFGFSPQVLACSPTGNMRIGSAAPYHAATSLT